MYIAILLACTFAISGPLVPSGAQNVHRAAVPQSKSMTVTGTLTDEGVECQAMRGDDKKLYTLSGDLKGCRTGDRVKVTGSVAEVSICMQGTTLVVETIERAP